MMTRIGEKSMPMRNYTRGERAIRWIEKFCMTRDMLDGEYQPVRFSLAERFEIRQFYLVLV
jgi:hypothetical protein